MPATRTTFDAALKEDYQPPIVEELNNSNVLLAQLEKNSDDVVGREAVFSIHVGRNSGIGSRAERGTLPAAGNQSYEDPRVKVKYHYGSGSVSGPAMRASRNDEGAFARLLDQEVTRIKDDLKRDVNRQVWGTSDGVIADCLNSGSSTTVIVIDNPTKAQMRQLEVGMIIDVGDDDTSSNHTTSRTITANDGVNSITVSPAMAGAPADTDRIVRAGNGGSTTAQKEFTGVQSIVDAGTALHGVAASVAPWNSTVLSNGGTPRPLTENLLAQAMHAVNIASGKDANLAITSDGVYRSFAALLQTQKRFPSTNALKGGFSGLSVQAGGPELTLTWDRDCPDPKLFGLATEALKIHQMSDWEFMDEDGALLRKESGVDAYEFTLFAYKELCTNARNRHFVIEDLAQA